jgi:hypothetical protein
MKEPRPDPKMSGRVAMLALVAMFIFVGLMVWIAG